MELYELGKVSRDASAICRHLEKLTNAVERLTEVMVYSGGEEKAQYILEQLSDRPGEENAS